MGEIPHLQAAVSRSKGQPFGILWISVDDTREVVKNMVQSKGIPGIQTWQKGSDNPVAQLYNVYDVPSWFLLDEQGIIRARDPFGDKLMEAMKTLSTAKKAKPKGSGG